MKNLLCLIGLVLLSATLFSQTVNPDNITIVRDNWGVPHIYAPTDVEATYGYVWAQCEDDFKTIQETFLLTKGRLGTVQGVDGAKLDFIIQALNLRPYLEANYETAISPEMKKILEAGAQAYNDYARLHPKEVFIKNGFPVSALDLVEGYSVILSFLSAAYVPFIYITENDLEGDQNPVKLSLGSNAIAMHSSITEDGENYLVINPHNLLEGPFSWYEAHMVSDEGLNMMGSSFIGTVGINHGANEHLSWAHTLNYPDFFDIYKLEMHPSKKLMYKFDDEWKKLEVRKIPLHVKTKLGITIKVKKKIYQSIHGPVMKNKSGYYAVRIPAQYNIKGPEAWYKMNKATNLEEFKAAIQDVPFPDLNIIYADRYDNIFYYSNAMLPYRDPAYNWQRVLPGNTSKTLWEAKFHTFDELPQYTNPSSGILFNTNHSPFLASRKKDNLDPKKYDATMGFQTHQWNRSTRILAQIEGKEKFSFQDLKDIKYDSQLPDPIIFEKDANQFKELDPGQFPKLTEEINLIKACGYKYDPNDMGVSLFVLSFYEFLKATDKMKYPEWENVDHEIYASCIKKASKHLKKHFGTNKVPFDKLQRHRRGKVDLPMPWLPEGLACMWSEKAKDGRLKSLLGDSYIMFVRWTDDGPILETVNAYGASNNPQSPHYTDQMDMFVNQKTKKMSLDKETIMKHAERVYTIGSLR